MVNIEEVLPDPNSLLVSKSVPSISFKDAKVGDSYTGIITELETAPVRDYETGEPKFWDDGKPQLQVVVTLATDYLDPEVEGDDGSRKVYLAGQKLTAAKTAMKEAGVTKLEKGFGFTIAYAGEKPSSNKKYNNVKLYGITIVPSKSVPAVDALLAAGAKPVDGKISAEQKDKVSKLAAAGFDEAEIAETTGLSLADVKASLLI